MLAQAPLHQPPAFDHNALLLGTRPRHAQPSRLKTDIALTAEQSAVVDAAASGASVSVNAFAGAGKTATALAVSQAIPGRVVYLAFGNAVAVEARRRFPTSVEVSTFHGLAYQQLNIAGWCQHAGRRLGEIPVSLIATVLGRKGPDALQHAWRVRQVFNRYLISGRSDIGAHLLPEEVRRSMDADDRVRSGQALEKLPSAKLEQIALLDDVRSLWATLWDPKDPAKLPICHDAYLKHWVMSDPVLPGAIHLVDEAQDCNPLMVEFLRKQETPRILLGDRHQAIFGFRGAINAMAALSAEQRSLTQSFRFGACIEMVANHLLALNGEREWLVGCAKDPGDLLDPDCGLEAFAHRVDGPFTVLTRTNAEALNVALGLCRRYPTAVLGGVGESLSLLRSALALFDGHVGEVRDQRLLQFISWGGLKSYVEQTHDLELKSLVELVEMRRLVLGQQLLDLELRLTSEAKARVLVSTSHKAKGREWDHVYLADDFRLPTPPTLRGDSDARGQEINLLYVATTRAKKTLRVNIALQGVLGMS